MTPGTGSSDPQDRLDAENRSVEVNGGPGEGHGGVGTEGRSSCYLSDEPGALSSNNSPVPGELVQGGHKLSRSSGSSSVGSGVNVSDNGEFTCGGSVGTNDSYR